ncbi:hypothetical protein Tcan_02101, partial [Toxocara canis]
KRYLEGTNFHRGFGKRMDASKFYLGFGKRDDSTYRLPERSRERRMDASRFYMGFGKRTDEQASFGNHPRNDHHSDSV